MEHVTRNIERQTGLHYNKLNAPVRSYVDNLRAQVYEVFKKYDVTNMTEFMAKMKKVEASDRQKVIKLMGAIEVAYKKNETPEFNAEFQVIREHEVVSLETFFGKKIEVPPLPVGVTTELLRFWEQNDFAMRYLPRIKMEANENFPGWLHKPGVEYCTTKIEGVGFYSGFHRIRNLRKNHINPHLHGLNPEDLPGAWVLADTRAKPNFAHGTQFYQNDTLIQGCLKQLASNGIVSKLAIGGLRNEIGAEVFDNPEFWKALMRTLKVDQIQDAIMRLPRVIEANFMGQWPGFHATNTWEWCEEYNHKKRRYISGDSDHGGASALSQSFIEGDGVGFRPLVVFPSSEK